MSRKIKIKLDNLEIFAELNDSITADKIWDALPIEGIGDLWGQEVYFRTNIVSAIDDTSKVVVEIGDIGFWPPNNAFCIFYGKTPMSTENEIRPASAVNIIGKLLCKANELYEIVDNPTIIVSRESYAS